MEVHDLDGRVRKVLKTLDYPGVAPERLSDQDDLYDAGLKSLTAVHLMLGLEDEFGIEFPESMLNRGMFSTVGRIREAVALLTDRRRQLSRTATEMLGEER